MYKIKQLPEDFVVKEISRVNTEKNGQYAYYSLAKTNFSTVEAIQMLADRFRMSLKNIGFAGNKDKNAVTEQKISIFRGSKNFENVNIKNIELKYLGNGKSPISLGDLEGNEFIITVRSLDDKGIERLKSAEGKKILVPNLFGAQRFSRNNHLVGKAIIKRDFKKAVALILENNGQTEQKIRQYLLNNKNNYVEALRAIPLKTRKLLVNSYQSFLFNKIAKEYFKKSDNKKINLKIPIIGFNFDMNSIKDKILKDIIKNILGEERTNPRDFIISQMPEMTSEGGLRDLFFELKNLKILEIADDDLNGSKQRVRISFVLPKSCYATTALEALFL